MSLLTFRPCGVFSLDFRLHLKTKSTISKVHHINVKDRDLPAHLQSDKLFHCLCTYFVCVCVCVCVCVTHIMHITRKYFSYFSKKMSCWCTFVFPIDLVTTFFHQKKKIEKKNTITTCIMLYSDLSVHCLHVLVPQTPQATFFIFYFIFRFTHMGEPTQYSKLAFQFSFSFYVHTF